MAKVGIKWQWHATATVRGKSIRAETSAKRPFEAVVISDSRNHVYVVENRARAEMIAK